MNAASPGERNLNRLIAGMDPNLDPSPYVFVMPPFEIVQKVLADAIGFFREEEGLTVVVDQKVAIRFGLAREPVWARITLRVNSSLEAVGFLARISARLASVGVPVNVFSAIHHDHLFVPWHQKELALNELRQMTTEPTWTFGPDSGS